MHSSTIDSRDSRLRNWARHSHVSICIHRKQFLRLPERPHDRRVW